MRELFVVIGGAFLFTVAVLVVVLVPLAYLSYLADADTCEKRAAVMNTKHQYVTGVCFVEHNDRMVPLNSIVFN